MVGAPFRDLGGIHTPAALNLYYDRVRSRSVREVPGLAVFIENKCVLQYGNGQYTRVTTD